MKLLLISCLLGLSIQANAELKKNGQLQKVCEDFEQDLSKEYRPKFRKNTCVIGVMDIAHRLTFNVIKTFNDACVAEGSAGVELAPGFANHPFDANIELKCISNK